MNDSASNGSTDAKGALNSVAKGGAAFGAGAIGAKLLVLTTGIIVIRSVDKTDFGLITLSYVLATILSNVALLGFGNGVPRMIARKGLRSREANTSYSAGSVVGSSFVISTLACILAATGLYFSADEVAELLDKPELASILRAFAFLILPLALIQNLTSAFQGVRISKTKMVFQDWTANIIKLALVLMLVVVGFTLERLVLVYVVAIWSAFLLYALYSIKKLPKLFEFGVSLQASKELLLFSTPILAASLTSRLGTWSGTLILGYAQTAEQVAVYNAPARIVEILLVPLAALNFLYIPIATRMHGNGNHAEHKELYASITKISSMITFPLVLFCIVDSEFIVQFLFGKEYLDAAVVLRILAIGYGIHAAFGPNGSTLISFGYTRPILAAAAVSSTMAICVSLLLVKSYGAVGVAIGTVSGMVTSNLLQHHFLFRRTGVFPFNRAWRASSLVFFLASLTTYALFSLMFPAGLLSHLAMLILFILFGLAAPLVSRSLNSEDIALLTALEQKFFKQSKYSSTLRKRLEGRKS